MSRRTVSRLVVAAVLLGAGGVGWAIYSLRVTEVRVVGAKSVAVNVIARAAGLKGGERILWTQMSAVARRVERVPGVRSVRVSRSLPGAVVIDVTERTPLARLYRREALVVDDDGVMFPFQRGRRLPLIAGWRGRARAGGVLDDVSHVVLHSFVTFPPALRREVARIKVGRDVTMDLRDGVQIRFGAPLDLRAKARSAELVIAAAADRHQRLAYVDVRAPTAPASMRWGATPAPTPTPAATPAPPATPSPVATPTPPPEAASSPVPPVQGR